MQILTGRTGQSALIGAVSCVALAAMSSMAIAADVSLSRVKVTSPDGKKSAMIERVDVKGTNLTRDEVAKLFSTTISKEERVAIASKMKASSVSIPQANITSTGKDAVQMQLSGLLIKNIDSGRFETFTFTSLSGEGDHPKSGGKVTFSSGGLVITDGDFSKMIAALKTGDVTNGTSRFGSFSWSNIQVRVPEKGRSGPAYHTVKVASITGEGDYKGDIPTKTVGAITGVNVALAPNSKAGQGMAAFGYKQVTMDMVFAGVYDPASKSYRLTEYTIKGPDTGTLTIKALFGNVDPVAFTGDKRQRMGAMMQGDVDQIEINFVNKGVFEKAVAFAARMKGGQPAQVQQQWAGMVGGMLPMFLGGDSAAMQVASTASDFVKNPKNITIRVNGKAGPIRFSDIVRTRNPMGLVGKLNIRAVANK